MNSTTIISVVQILATIMASTKGQLTWQVLHDGEIKPNGGPVPTPRRDMGMGYDGLRNVLIMFGGRGTENGTDIVFGDTWIFDISTNSWRHIESERAPPARFSFVSGLSHDQFYVSTGEGPEKNYHNDIWRFNLKTEKWEELPVEKRPMAYTSQQWAAKQHKQVYPKNRYGAAGGIYPNSTRFYISMGFGKERREDTLSYSLEAIGWYKEYASAAYSPDNPHSRCLHAGTMLSSDELLIYGGCLSGGGTGGACPARDSWIFDAKEKAWIPIKGCASARYYASLSMLPSLYGERRVVLYGGIEDGPQVLNTARAPHNQLAIFNPDTRSWELRQAEGNIPRKRASAAMATGKDGIFMFGGASVEDDTLHNDIYILIGSSFSADQAPLQAECNATFFNLIMIHSVLMVLSWGFFLQWGAFIARYAKHRAPLWFHIHRLFQVFGLALAIAGFIVGVVSVRQDHFQFPHAVIGLVIMILGILQPINSLVRPQKTLYGEKKPIKRIVWEFFHKNVGRCGLILGIVNISLGLFLALAHQIIWAAWYTHVTLLLVSYFVAESRKTYIKDRESSKDSGDKNQKLDVSASQYQRPRNSSEKETSPNVRSYGKAVYENPALVS